MLYRYTGPLPIDGTRIAPERQFRWLIWTVACFFVGTLGVILILILNTTYRANLEIATQNVEDKATLFRRSAELVVGDLDSLLLSISDRVANDELADEPLQGYLARIAATVPSIRVLLVVDTEGRVIADSRTGETAVGTDVSDRSYYLAHLRPGDSGLVIGQPVQSRFDGSWSIPLSRAVRDGAGRLRAVVTASVSPLYFEQVLSSVATYPSEAGRLIRAEDRLILASFPHDDSIVGQPAAVAEGWGGDPSGRASLAQARVDDSGLITSYLPLQRWPLLVSYSVDSDEALASFRQSALASTAVTGLLTLIIIAIAGYQTRQVRLLAGHTLALQQLNEQLGQEVAQRREAEQSLRLYEQAVESSGDLVLVLDRSHSCRIVNATYLRYQQQERAEVVGQAGGAQIGGQVDYEQLRAYVERCLEGESFRFELKSSFPSLGERDLSIGIFPITDGAGAILGAVIIARDITDLVALEQQYQQAQKIETIGRLAGGIAHDFNNLLAPIVGYAELGMMDLPPESKLYGQLKEIQSAGEKGASLTRQILAFSRSQVPQVQVIDLNEVITNLKKLIHRLIGEDIELETALSGDLQPISADKGQIEQVLMNIVVNAREAMPQGGRLRIETDNVLLDEAFVRRHAGAQARGQYVLLTLSDTGQGMDERTRARIFEPFFTTKEQGTGLGLATVQGIVKQHGGIIRVESALGKGTTFSIYLPRTDQATTAALAPPPTEAELHGTERVLVVEDEAMVRALICEALRAYGYEVVEAETPKEAIARAAGLSRPIDLLVTDVIMPGMNGRELRDRLSAADAQMQTLYISGYTDSIIAYHGVAEGGPGFLQKPFTIRSLLRAVRAALGVRRPG